MKNSKKSGFTLIEVIVCVAIITLLVFKLVLMATCNHVVAW